MIFRNGIKAVRSAVGKEAFRVTGLVLALAMLAGAQGSAPSTAGFGPSNPFYAKSTLPFEAPAFDKIKDADYQPAIEAGIAGQRMEYQQIGGNAAAPTFENTIVALEKSGQLLDRVMRVFGGVSQANLDPEITKVKQTEAPKLAALDDALYLDPKIFQRVAAVYQQRDKLKLDAESRRLVEIYYQRFVHAGANLGDEDKAKLKKLNEEESTLDAAFSTKLVAAAKAATYFTTDKNALAGMSEAQIAAAAETAKAMKHEGYAILLQNTTQQPAFDQLSNRGTRQTIFQNSGTRATRGDDNDTRATIERLAQLRAEKAKLLGYPNYAAWILYDQMAKTPQAALDFMNALVPGTTKKVQGEAKDIQALIDSRDKSQGGGFKLEPWDFEYYAEQIQKSKYAMDEEQIKPYFELNSVLTNGLFYEANQLYGLTFQERKDIPVYQPDVRVFEVRDVDGKPLALFYCDYFKRDNKFGGGWTGLFVGGSKLLGTLPVIYNVTNFAKPSAGDPALLTFDDVTTMFHEFGHALNGMFGDTTYPTLWGASVPRDFVEFPSQFNEHWATYPAVFDHYAKHYKTGAAMPAGLAAKVREPAAFGAGYALAELLEAAEIDVQWHLLPTDAPLQDADTFDDAALRKVNLALSYVPPRYRASYFLHIWSNGYASRYYAYLWSEMLDDDAFQWFLDHGGLTRENGDRFRQMVLARGNTEDLAKMYANWRGGAPSIGPMLKFRGLPEMTKERNDFSAVRA